MAPKTARPRPAAPSNSPVRRARATGAAPGARRELPTLTAPTAIAIVESSGNVFADLGLPDPAERMAKAVLSRIVHDRVRELVWTQRAAATALGIATSDMSDVMRGKLARFSQERLERMLNALDLDVVIHVGPRPAWKARADVTVTRVTKFTR